MIVYPLTRRASEEKKDSSPARRANKNVVMPRPLNILVSGMIAGDPHQGGATWAVLQYVLGLQRLGHHVILLEPARNERVIHNDDVMRYFGNVVEEFSLLAALLLPEGIADCYDMVTNGKPIDILFNVSGMLTDESLLQRIPIRVYLDLDPAFIQCWHVQGIDMHLDAHTHFVTVGQGIGTPSCPVQTCGREWIPTLPPVVLERWPVAKCDDSGAFTTIANWRGYGSVTHGGVFYGQKAHSLRKFIELPTRTIQRIAPAIAIHPGDTADVQALNANGWQVQSPTDVAGDPTSYQRFIQSSKAELGIAKLGYVASRCGWFSDRSAVYLASGRPVLAQNTGFDAYLPTGEGLLSFDTLDNILAGIDAINSDYSRHRKAARAIAEEHFDSDRVLTRLLGRVGL
ncbi:hypothetical protein BH11PLA2_BH11PLA2_17670 [soil metagenome]